MTNQRSLDILHLQAECLWLYSQKTNLSFKESIKHFKRFHILEYISVCYDYLHLSGVDYIVRDIIKRVKEGVNFVV